MSKVQSPKSKVQAPKSKVQGPRSEVQRPRSKVQGRRSRAGSPGSEVRSQPRIIRIDTDKRWRFGGPKSRVPSPRSEAPGPKSAAHVLHRPGPVDSFSSSRRDQLEYSPAFQRRMCLARGLSGSWCPVGTTEYSPAFQRWVRVRHKKQVP